MKLTSLLQIFLPFSGGDIEEPPEPLGSFRVGSLSISDSSSVGSMESMASSSVGSLGMSARSTVGSLVIEE